MDRIRRIDHSALVQQQATVAQITKDVLQNPANQDMFSRHAAEVEDRVFIENPIQIQARELAESSFRIVILPSPDCCNRSSSASNERATSDQLIRRTTPFALWIMRLDQNNQALPGHDMIHLDQEALATGLLTLAGVLGNPLCKTLYICILARTLVRSAHIPANPACKVPVLDKLCARRLRVAARPATIVLPPPARPSADRTTVTTSGARGDGAYYSRNRSRSCGSYSVTVPYPTQ